MIYAGIVNGSKWMKAFAYVGVNGLMVEVCPREPFEETSNPELIAPILWYPQNN